MTLTKRQQYLKGLYAVLEGVEERAKWMRAFTAYPFVDLSQHEWPDLGGKYYARPNITTVSDIALWRAAHYCTLSDSGIHEVWTFGADINEQASPVGGLVTMFSRAHDMHVAVTVVEEDDGTLNMYPVTRQARHTWDIPGAREEIKRSCYQNLRWLADAMHRLRESDLYAVEVTPPPLRGREQRRYSKTVQKMPWLSQGRSIIFMNPSERHVHTSTSQGGTHASPSPHHRRGHHKTLRHERYTRNPDGTPRRVWVKPAWIGDREWIHQGSTYRVVEGQESE